MAQHIEEFAGRLRALKERSGRSYGMLAARLHVSTSTLHRYCNGVAVPAEYAPVERFARQCGASAEELVALHRLWLLADAAKRREPQRAPDPEAGQPAPVAAESTAPRTGEAPPGPIRSGEVAEAAEAAEVAPPDPGPLPDGPELPGVVRTPGTAGGRRTGRRAGRTTVVLAVVAALAAVLPLVWRSGGGAADSAATVPRRPVTGGKPPVQVSVLADNWHSQCGQWFLLPLPPAKVPPPPSLQEGKAWAAALGGVPAGHLRLELTAQGLPGSPVVLHALYVKVLGSVAAPKGNVYSPADGCGGGLDPASFTVDLDTTTPRARAVPGSVDDGRGTGTADFPFRISASEPQVLDVDAHTLDHDVRWYLDLVWSCGARQGVLRVDDHGAPFRTTGMEGDPMYGWSTTRWYRSPPDQS
ncbi:helix-turn-helix transcriptional regulator [Streptomyces sp. V4-01]|uniref:Helix-turn-helix transcriptional regulator n=1 Tax=Actinacidiphila polyblastidii TaxID=3110430 RepID=A0ABU7PM57_9ACTN|nr:helix-turn-helix transcriptional regulator [Streptomyces sp. V4-01]